MWYSYKLEFPQPLVDNSFVLSKLITEEVMGIVQTQLLNLLESFLPVKIGNIGFVPKNHHENSNVTLLQTKIAQIIGW